MRCAHFLFGMAVALCKAPSKRSVFTILHNKLGLHDETMFGTPEKTFGKHYLGILLSWDGIPSKRTQ